MDRRRMLLALGLVLSLLVACCGIADADEQYENYNSDEKVIISDIVGWQHPTKASFKFYRFQVNKIDLYADGTYPVFYLQQSGDFTIYDYRFLSDVAQENGFWDYKIITPNGFVEVYCDKAKERVIRTRSDIGDREYDKYDLKTAPEKAMDLVINHKKLSYNAETDDYSMPGKAFTVKLRAGGFDKTGRYEIRICPSYYTLSVFHYCYVDLQNETVYVQFE